MAYDDELTRRKMTKKESQTVDAIIKKASKRRHKKEFTVKFICYHLENPGFIKGWDYNCKLDVKDMLVSITKILIAIKYFNQKQADEFIEYYMKEYAEAWFPDDKRWD